MSLEYEPERLETSGIPETPGTSRTPGAPGTSRTPGAPGTFRTPGTPGIPGTPGTADPELAGQRWRLLDDPLAIRALAHPLRHELMSIIGRLGRATTADAARELGISHGLASHHLRQLAKYGFVEQVKGKDHRERPWRLVATSYNWSPATATTEGSHAVDVLEQVLAEQALSDFLDWQQRRKTWPKAWREHSGIGTSTIYLTQAELAGLAESIDALINHYANERPLDDVASRPPASVPVDFTFFAMPRSGPPEGD
jgi:DNA-binding transcriptional ArsR family regulator